eukprot:PLAT15284.1.p1 GENE.PLAT15284.1~~PLAT15284.1.p1  ORF type:complete len:419 (-),score=236.57 PLAT15284.1:131-1387(-)
MLRTAFSLRPAASGAVRALSSAGATIDAAIRGELDAIREAGTFKTERVLTSSQNAHIHVSTAEDAVLNFCANNYLGLADDPALVAAAKEGLDSRGLGLASVRFICGTQDVHKKLEATVADFHRQESAILYASCFDANAGLFEVLLGEEDAVITDELNHASIIDGIRLCKAARMRYKHMDLDDLEAKLVEAKGARRRLIATDGVFSMDGDIAPLDDICRLADKHDALVFIDECHATGFLGEHGRGTAELLGVEDRIDIVNSTLGKALGGSTGGYTAASEPIVELLRQRSRPYLFSNSLAPAVVTASQAVFDRLTADNSLVAKVSRNTQFFRKAMTDAGFTLSGHADHPIVPVMLGDARLASQFADAMLERGIYVIGFSYPVVPEGKARIRTQMSAAHDEADLQRAVDAFVQVGKQLGVI